VEPFSAEVIEQMKLQDWPGNIRELQNQVRRTCIFGTQENANNKPLASDIIKKSLEQQTLLKTVLEQIEKEYITEVLLKNKGLIPPTHQQLGISRKSLYDKIHKYDINLEILRK
jgi:DNA-binding NtrC family response regulator